MRLKNRAINYVNAAASRALITMMPRGATEGDSLLTALAVRTGLSLFEKCRAAVRRTRP